MSEIKKPKYIVVVGLGELVNQLKPDLATTKKGIRRIGSNYEKQVEGLKKHTLKSVLVANQKHKVDSPFIFSVGTSRVGRYEILPHHFQWR